MFWGLVEGEVNIPSGALNYLSFGKGQKNLIIIQGLNVRDIKGAGISLAFMYKKFSKNYRVWFFDRRTVVKDGLTNWDLAEDIYFAMNAYLPAFFTYFSNQAFSSYSKWRMFSLAE